MKWSLGLLSEPTPQGWHLYAFGKPSVPPNGNRSLSSLQLGQHPIFFFVGLGNNFTLPNFLNTLQIGDFPFKVLSFEVLDLQLRRFEMLSCSSGVTGVLIGRLVEIGPHLIINSKDEFLILKEVQLVPGRDPLVVG